MAKKKNDEQAEQQPTTVFDYVIPGKVEAFCATYKPCADVRMADELFDDSRLRHYFQAGTVSCGDVLAAYMDLLRQEGFGYVTDPDTAQCVLPVRLRLLAANTLLGME